MNAEDPQTSPVTARAPEGLSGTAACWTILVVDDQEAFHVATRLVLDTTVVFGRPLQLLSAYSATEAREILEERDDVAVVLLDLVMETETAGLALVRWIRQERGDRAMRIILSTARAGGTPAWQILLSHDINDYRAKNTLTADLLLAAIVLALRSFQEVEDLYPRRRGGVGIRL